MALLFAGHSNLSAPAYADAPQQTPIAGGAGIFVMPAQFHPAVWGCYLMDVDRQTLCTYEYRAGEKALVLTSARSFRYDLQLKNFNTSPFWYDVQKLVQEQDNTDRINGSNPPPQSPEAPAGNP
jgi:hypothetical protein